MLSRKSLTWSLIIFMGLIGGGLGSSSLLANMATDRQEQSIPIPTRSSTTIPRQQVEGTLQVTSSLVANAGEDQTVPGPSPVEVQFDGTGSTGDIVSYKWVNQYGLLRAEGATPVIEVNFGHRENPKPGTQRTFSLVVEDANGNTDEDQVVITLGETPADGEEPPPVTPAPPAPPRPPAPPQGDPLIGNAFNGTTFYSDDLQENLTVGFLTNKKQWYVGVGLPDSGTGTTVECHYGTLWKANEDAGYSTGHDTGCAGHLDSISRDPFIHNIIETHPQYEGDLITQWQVRAGGSVIATVTFEQGKSYKSGAAVARDQRW
jgi:hypothetical protein